MTKFRLFLSLAAFVVFVTAASPVHAELPMTPAKPATKPPVQPIADQLQTLITGTSAPAANPPAGQAAPPQQQQPQQIMGPMPGPAPEENVEPQETFGTKALNLLISSVDLLAAQTKSFFSNFSAIPDFYTWLEKQKSDPRLSDRWKEIGHYLTIVVGIPLGGAILLELLLLPLANHIRRREPKSFTHKLAPLFGLFVVKLLPILAFIGISLVLLDQNSTQKIQRFVALNIIYALALNRFILVVARTILAPHAPSLRLIPAQTHQVAHAYHWITAFSYAIIYGYFFVDLAHGLRLPLTTITSFTNALSLLIVVMGLVVIIKKRSFVSLLLRGNLSAAQQDLTALQSLRLILARRWHILAIAYLIIGFLVTVLGVDKGFALMLRGTILTLLIFATMRLMFHGIERWGMSDTMAGAALHHAIIRTLMQAVIWVLGGIGIAAAWGADIMAFFGTPLGQRVMGATFSVGGTIVILAFIYESFSNAIERHLNKRDSDGNVVQASARTRTLLPMIRNTAFIIFALIVGMVVLSEAGISIGPLIAGAGVIGVAIGFGSQALVKDFITGLFIVIENNIAIGDVVQIGTHKGVVEAMNIRTLRIRDGDGALHILPFGMANEIINMTKDFSYALLNVGVSYDSDLEHVMTVIRSVGEAMQNDPIFKRVILDPVEILGVEALGDFSITISFRMRTRPGKQWDVKRMFLLKLKQRFDKEGIVIPFPTSIQLHKEP